MRDGITHKRTKRYEKYVIISKGNKSCTTMTIAVMNTIKNKFVVGIKMEECAFKMLCIDCTAPAERCRRWQCRWWQRQNWITLNRYCHQCTQNGSILDFNQCVFAFCVLCHKNHFAYFHINQWIAQCTSKLFLSRFIHI